MASDGLCAAGGCSTGSDQAFPGGCCLGPASTRDVVLTDQVAQASADVPEIMRMHVLPLGEADDLPDAAARLEALAPELRQRRTTGDVLKAGEVLRVSGRLFAVVKCEPSDGRLTRDTEYYLDGPAVVLFRKIQFIAWGPADTATESAFQQVVAPYFRRTGHEPFQAESSRQAEYLYTNQVLQVSDFGLQVEATEPEGLGVVTADTELFVEWDPSPEFAKVHIVPFRDTLPQAYEYDIFHDYLESYLRSNMHKKFTAGELFSYHGVEFKLVAAEPEVLGRIGKRTTIYCDGVLHPSLRNLLPTELLRQVQQLPRGLQLLLLSQERTSRELEDLLANRRGLFEDTLQEIERMTWTAEESMATSQSTCMICLCDFDVGDQCRRLPCRHVFHDECVCEWLRRCTDCPICKANVDRAIRHY